MKKALITTVLLAGLSLSGAGFAQVATPWVVRFGAHTVDPKSNNGSLAGGTLAARVSSDTKPTFSVEYMFNKNLGL